MQRQGLYPPPPGAPDIPGLEIAGEVAALGAGVKRWKIGDRVFALVIGGGYAEYCLAHESHALPLSGLTMVDAAAIPETMFTVWHNMVERGGLKSGETFLVHGGSSGIGTTAIQIAKALGARVIVTAGSKDKCDACRKLGADVAIDYKTQDFVAETKAATGDKGADVILDMVGGDYIARNYEAAAVEGRIVQIAFQGSPKATVDFRRIMLKRLHHTGSTLRSRSVADKGAIARAVEDNVLPMIAAGKFRPVIYKTFPLREASAAHALMEIQCAYRENCANYLNAQRNFGRAGLAPEPRNRHNSGPNWLKFQLRQFTAGGARTSWLQDAAFGRGFGLNVIRCATAIALALTALLAGLPARAVEAINVRIDVPAIDLTAATELQKTDTDRIQVSTAPGPDGIVRRIEVRAREGGIELGGVCAHQQFRRADRPADRRAALPHGRLRPVLARPRD